MKNNPPAVCPVCGEDVPLNARACPECGADERSGWSNDCADGLDLPEEEFDYEEFAATEFGGKRLQSRMHFVWAAVAVLVLIALLSLLISLR